MKEELYTELSIELNALKIKHFKLESIVNNIANTFSKDTVKSSDGDMAYGHIMDLNINIDTISEFVSEWFGVNISKRNRTQGYMWPRFFYFYLSKRYTRLTLDRIGRKVKMHHATVLHGSRRHEEMIEYNDKDYMRCIAGAEEGFITYLLKLEK
jgi:chromosomal replication initiation ATPase DnaA